ncbi:MAG: response regulator transcription factor [Pseudomonadota bacterium]
MNLLLEKTHGLTVVTQHYSVLIVDDHELVQQGLIALLKHDQRFQVCGALVSGAQVVPFAKTESVDIVVLDINLPDMSGISLLSELIGVLDMTVVILTGEENPKDIDVALRLGARAIISKSDSSEHLTKALDLAVQGSVFLSPQIERIMGKRNQPVISLSPRQMAILHLLAVGETNKEIGYRLNIAPPTVSFHLAELRKKLGVTGNKKILGAARKFDLI